MFKSKFDPLAAIEAKHAILVGTNKTYLLDNIQEDPGQKQGRTEVGEKHQELAEVLEEEKMSQQILDWGSQEPPRGEVSSQEDMMDTNKVGEDTEVEIIMGGEMGKGLEAEKKLTPKKTVDREQTADDEENIKAQKEEIQGKEEQVIRRQSERVKKQGLEHIKVTEKAEALTMKKNLEGLQEEEKEIMETGVEMLKAAALQFHPQEAGQDDIGMVLLQ